LTEFEKGGGLVLWSEDLDEGGWLKTIKDRPVPIVAKGGEENLGMAVYRNSDGTKYVINISAHHSKDVTLSLSSEFFKNPVSAHENVSAKSLRFENLPLANGKSICSKLRQWHRSLSHWNEDGYCEN
jgi:hypothetical protein